jgi:ketosteroid isomerase-like protein
MADNKIIERAYSAFNKRDIDGALALMTQDASWPKAASFSELVDMQDQSIAVREPRRVRSLG